MVKGVRDNIVAKAEPYNLCQYRIDFSSVNGDLVKCYFRFHSFTQIATFLFYMLLSSSSFATNYLVSTKADLQSRMNAALPGDTIIVANGTYNWGQINFANNNGSVSSAWIVLKSQTFKGVTFAGNTYLQFKGTRVMVDGFVFANGNAGTNAVISFRSSSSNLANHCRISNIVIDNYNTPSADSTLENEWVGLYGTNNRVDHCTFINKYNARATIVVWYAATTYPAPAPSTYHRIDSNYFNGRSFMGENGGETIRVGTSTSSRTDGFNLIEYNLFENCIQAEPEIISNKSDFNTYRYNTFKNCRGGLTLRHGRFCDVYSNFFIVDHPSVIEAYGVRVIDKGHRIFNNYFEGVNGNSGGGSSQLRAPINLYNGLSTDTTDPTAAAGYFAADSCIVAFNTILNAKGGGGIVLGGTGGGTIQPKGIVLANNLVKMSSGSALFKNSANTALTFFAEGNLYSAPSGLGVSTSGWTNTTLNFGTRVNGTLTPPSSIEDLAVNSASYSSLLSSLDSKSKTRNAIFDPGAEEVPSNSATVTHPLDSTMVGAGKPSVTVLPVQLIKFTAEKSADKILLVWNVAEAQGITTYEVQHSIDGISFSKAGIVTATSSSQYNFYFTHPVKGKNYFRLKMIEYDGRNRFSKIILKDFMFSSYRLYPNPVKDEFVIDQLNESEDIAIFDANGRVVKQQKVAPAQFVKVKDLGPGLYYLKLIHTKEVHAFIIIP